MKKGVDLINKNELDQAKKTFEFVLNNVIGLPDGYYYLSKIVYKQGDIKKSKELFRDAMRFLYVSVNLDPKHKEAFVRYEQEYRNLY